MVRVPRGDGRGGNASLIRALARDCGIDPEDFDPLDCEMGEPFTGPRHKFLKAMGTGFRHGVWVRDVGITNNEWGRPLIIWSERGRGVCERLGIGKGHVSLTDDAGLVIACAVVEAAE